jgi:hypothetical protein
MTALEHESMTETFEDVKLLIYRTVHKFARQHNVPFEELLGPAHFCFVRSYHKFKPKRGAKLSTWVCWVTQKHLLTYLSKTRKHRGHAELNEELVGYCPPDTFVGDFCSELSDDARTVALLLLDGGGELGALMRMEKATTKTSVLRCLHEHLEDIGWAAPRIAASFNEIRNALK